MRLRGSSGLGLLSLAILARVGAGLHLALDGLELLGEGGVASGIRTAVFAAA
jgi:hypothetical protein